MASNRRDSRMERERVMEAGIRIVNEVRRQQVNTLLPQHAQPSSSRPPTQTRPYQQHLRPLSQEETTFFDTLISTLDSDTALTLHAIQTDTPIPQCRLHIRYQISEFLKHSTCIPPPDQPFYPPGTRFATTSANLIEICQKVDGVQRGKREKGISLAEFQRRRKEALARRRKDDQSARSVSGSSVGGQSRLRTGDGSDLRLSPGNDASVERKGKGKRRLKRRAWDDDGEGDILDALD